MCHLTVETLRQLVCPVCHQTLQLEGNGNVVRCQGCGRRYPILDGIPVLLAERSIPVENRH